MTDLLLPPNFPTLGRHEYDISIDGRDFTLRFAWNVRVASWYMDVLDEDDVVLRQGVRMVVDFPLLFRSKLTALPLGLLMAVDVSGAHEDMTNQFELSERVQLVYTPVEAFGAAVEDDALTVVVL